MEKPCKDQCCFESELFDAQPQPDCAKCGKPCYYSNPIIYQKRYWHPKCFVCSLCGHDLRHGYFTESSVANFECSQCFDKLQKQLHQFNLKRCHLCNRSTRNIVKNCKKYFHQPYHQCHCIHTCDSQVTTPSDRCKHCHLPHKYKWPYFRHNHSSSLEDVISNNNKSKGTSVVFNPKNKFSLKNDLQTDLNESDESSNPIKQPSKHIIHTNCSMHPSQHTLINSQTQTPTTIFHSNPTIDASSQTSINYSTGFEDNALSYSSFNLPEDPQFVTYQEKLKPDEEEQNYENSSQKLRTTVSPLEPFSSSKN